MLNRLVLGEATLLSRGPKSEVTVYQQLAKTGEKVLSVIDKNTNEKTIIMHFPKETSFIDRGDLTGLRTTERCWVEYPNKEERLLNVTIDEWECKNKPHSKDIYFNDNGKDGFRAIGTIYADTEENKGKESFIQLICGIFGPKGKKFNVTDDAKDGFKTIDTVYANIHENINPKESLLQFMQDVFAQKV